MTTKLEGLRAAARDCRACPLWEHATQTVFGAGAPHASLLVVGEQPGDQEDRQGLPFVGPAGRLLDKAFAAAGIDRREVYVTNAVKHFKWVAGERGKPRIHKKPNAVEIRACQPWLLAEIAALQPRAIVCLGATAAQSLLGRDFRVTQQRGVPLPSPFGPPGAVVVATVHPAAILRAPPEDRESELRMFVADLRAVRALLEGATSSLPSR
jgi:uracil-DNA glycosylase family protein